MSEIDQYKSLNIRAEVLLAELLEKRVFSGIDELSVQPDGGFNSMVRRDIDGIVNIENEHGLSTTKVTIARKGFYDALPEGLFHFGGKSGQTDAGSEYVDRSIQKIKKRKQEEKAARKLFSPFDQAFNRYRLRLELQERQVLTGFPIGTRHSLFDIIWNDFDGQMSNYQKSILFSLLPLTHHIVGDFERTKLALEAVTGLAIKIESGRQKLLEVKYEDNNVSLGNTFLAQDFVLGNQSDEIETCVNICVGPIPLDKVEDYLPGAIGCSVLETLRSYFFSFDQSINFKYLIQTTALELENARSESAGTSRLGYSIHL